MKLPLPPNVIDKMEGHDRKPLGRAGMTTKEASARYQARFERKEQNLFAGMLKLCRARGELLYDWTATHKPSTAMAGRPDFLIMADNRLLQIEFKAPSGALSPQQREWQDISLACGCDYYVIETADAAHNLLKTWLYGKQ